MQQIVELTIENIEERLDNDSIPILVVPFEADPYEEIIVGSAGRYRKIMDDFELIVQTMLGYDKLPDVSVCSMRNPETNLVQHFCFVRCLWMDDNFNITVDSEQLFQAIEECADYDISSVYSDSEEDEREFLGFDCIILEDYFLDLLDEYQETELYEQDLSKVFSVDFDELTDALIARTKGQMKQPQE